MPQPLKVHPTNPRYVTPDGERAILLVGSHTWDNLKDMGKTDPPAPFDWHAYLDMLASHHHNFIRLWAWDHTQWESRANAQLGKDYTHHVAPHPWLRTGPGNALDGKPKFDLTKFNPDYFDRLRHRVVSAGERGMYVSIMLFEGWCLYHANRGRQAEAGWAWKSHPFNPANNVNGLAVESGGEGLDGFVHRLGNEKVNALQADYVRHVVDTVNDLDTVLYEVINEGGSPDWDWWIADLIHEYEKSKPKQHLVGITGHGSEGIESMLASPADWTSPGGNDGFRADSPAWHHSKPSLHDTDHIWGCGGNAEWVWKSMLRGHNPIFMDPYLGNVLCDPNDTWWFPIRKASGHARRLTERIDLAASEPRGYLSSSGYCLAVPRKDYLVYAPGGSDVTVDLRGASGSLSGEWIHPVTGEITKGDAVQGGAKRSIKSPIEGDAILFLHTT
ncbi:MAG: DUF6298 domain-containing protein [Candidatus Poribacteria bacterium]|nr:DUF6298 domain-containing protein [Candidatus Poribacteria bacterium]